jgi:hypothetical protein
MWGASDWNQWLPTTTNDRPEFNISVMWAISDFTTRNGATRVIPGSHRWERNTSKKLEHPSEETKKSVDMSDEGKNASAGGNLDDLAAEGQAMRHAAGVGMEFDDPEKIEAMCVPATMTKGSVLLWSGATIHGAGAHSPHPEQDNSSAVIDTTTTTTPFNRDDATRRGLIFIYNLGWLRTEHNWNFAMPPDVISSFTTSLQELMGIVGTNKVDHPWYTGPVYAQPLLGSAVEENDSPLSVNSNTAFNSSES